MDYLEQLRERLRLIVEHKFEGNSRAYARAIDWMDEGAKLKRLQRILAGPERGGNKKIDTDLIEDTLRHIPDVPRGWLESGSGPEPPWLYGHASATQDCMLLPIVDFIDGKWHTVGTHCVSRSEVSRMMIDGISDSALKVHVVKQDVMSPVIPKLARVVFAAVDCDEASPGHYLCMLGASVVIARVNYMSDRRYKLSYANTSYDPLILIRDGDKWVNEYKEHVTFRIVGIPILWTTGTAVIT